MPRRSNSYQITYHGSNEAYVHQESEAAINDRKIRKAKRKTIIRKTFGLILTTLPLPITIAVIGHYVMSANDAITIGLGLQVGFFVDGVVLILVLIIWGFIELLDL